MMKNRHPEKMRLVQQERKILRKLANVKNAQHKNTYIRIANNFSWKIKHKYVKCNLLGVKGQHGLKQAHLVDEGDKDYGLPVLLLPVEVLLEVGRVELDDRALLARH